MIHYQEPNATIYSGHAIEELKAVLAGSVDMCITSPPYWGLRTYKTEPQIWGDNNCEHEWGRELIKAQSHRAGETNPGKEGYTKDVGAWSDKQGQFCLKCNAWRGELGLEPTIELYISHLIQIFNEVKRVLKKTGTCWVNIDDSYYGGGFGHEKDLSAEDFAKKYPKQGSNKGTKLDWQERKMVGDTKRGNLLPAKSLCLIPQRFAIAMVEQGWILRNDIVWDKPNPMPESVKDRFTGSWEHLYFFVKNKKYWFEQQFEAYQPTSLSRMEYPMWSEGSKGQSKEYAIQSGVYNFNELGRNKRDVWEISTQGYPEAHFATFPEKLCETPILAGCPAAICKKCGKAREKVYQVVGKQITGAMRIAGCNEQGEYEGQDTADYKSGLAQSPSDTKRRILESMSEVKEYDYTDCGCNAGFESGVVLDPFCGSGTVLAVAKRLNRKGIGIDINPDYCKLATKRIQEIPIPMDLRV